MFRAATKTPSQMMKKQTNIIQMISTSILPPTMHPPSITTLSARRTSSVTTILFGHFPHLFISTSLVALSPLRRRRIERLYLRLPGFRGTRQHAPSEGRRRLSLVKSFLWHLDPPLILLMTNQLREKGQQASKGGERIVGWRYRRNAFAVSTPPATLPVIRGVLKPLDSLLNRDDLQVVILIILRTSLHLLHDYVVSLDPNLGDP